MFEALRDVGFSDVFATTTFAALVNHTLGFAAPEDSRAESKSEQRETSPDASAQLVE